MEGNEKVCYKFLFNKLLVKLNFSFIKLSIIIRTILYKTVSTNFVLLQYC